jgi:hypothetical protein
MLFPYSVHNAVSISLDRLARGRQGLPIEGKAYHWPIVQDRHLAPLQKGRQLCQRYCGTDQQKEKVHCRRSFSVGQRQQQGSPEKGKG